MSFLKNTLLFLFLIITASVSAQNTDSLKKLLTTTQAARQRLVLSYDIGSAYDMAGNADSAIFYYSRTLQLSVAQHSDSITMESEAGLARMYTATDNFSVGFEHIEKAIAIAKQTDNKKRCIRFLMAKCSILGFLNRKEEAIKIADNLPQLCENINDKEDLAKTYSLLADYKREQYIFDEALELLNKAMKINDSLKNYKDLSDDYSTIINIWGSQSKYKEALKYSLIRDSIDRLSNDINNQQRNRVGLAMAYSAVGNIDTAIILYKNAIKYYANVPSSLNSIYPQFAQTLTKQGKYKEAVMTYHSGMAINSRLHNSYIEVGSYFGIAQALFLLGEADSSLYYAKQCEAMSNGKPDIDNYEVFSLMAEIYGNKGDAKNAMLYYKKYIATKDSIYADNQLQSIAEQEAKFKLGENKRQLELLAKENELNKVRKQQQAIALILGSAIIIVVVYAYRRSIKRNQLLNAQKEIIDGQVIQLETAAAMKTKFLANISHELRTPTTLLTGMLEMIKNKAQKNEAVDATKALIAFNNSRKLQYMIEEILDLSRVENKTTEVNSKVKEINPLLRRMVFAFETFIEKEQLLLKYNDSITQNIYVGLDEDKFEKIINNLIYNAIKFNSTGGEIKVNTSLAANNTQLAIEVADTGSGILPEDLPHIFERFYQGTTSNKAKAEGVGIGLSLVKELVVLMNGTIKVSSKPGEGAIFTLQFPISEKEQLTTETNEETLLPLDDRWLPVDGKNNILIVEDNAEMRYYLREILGDRVNIAEAANGKEALVWLENNMPDLIISDMMMPEMDGREFVSIIKKDDRYNKIPVITLTALADMDNHLSMLGLGVDDYIVKPFNADELRIRVRNLLNNFAVRREFGLAPAEPEDELVSDEKTVEFKEKVKQYVLVNLKNENINVDDLAKELALSTRQLYRLAKSLTGYTPAQLIKEVRLQKAYEMLLSENIYKLEYVSKHVGFENQTYFSRQFIERFGKHPSELLKT